MSTDLDGVTPQERQAIENICRELHRLYRQTVGKEPTPEVLRAEAEYLVARHGTKFKLQDLF